MGSRAVAVGGRDAGGAVVAGAEAPALHPAKSPNLQISKSPNLQTQISKSPNPDSERELRRRASVTLSVSVLVQDLKLSLRQLRRRPVFALGAILTLAIGMGVNAVAFTVVNGVLFRSAAARLGPGLGRVATTPGGEEGGYASLPEYERFVDATTGALDLAAEGRTSLAWRHGTATETAWTLFVSANYFSLVDIAPVAGRIDVAAPGVAGTPTCVVGERFWRTRLDAAPLGGLELQLNGTSVAVVGVLPEAFTGPGGLYSPDVWLPLADIALFRPAAMLRARDARWLFLFGRLAPGAASPEVRGRLEAAAAAMAHDWPETHADRGATFRLFSEGGSSEIGRLRTLAAIPMGIIGLVLVLACFNVANLLLSRAVERERDMGVRAALGAGPMRLVRLVVTEGFVIAVLAGALALLLASWTQTFVGSFAMPIDEPQHIDLTPDATVVWFTALLVLVAGIAPGLWPAMKTARVDVLRVLQSQGGGAAHGRPSRVRRVLVGVQVAGCTAFLVIAALFAQSYGRLARADMGFDADHLLVAEFDATANGRETANAEGYARALADRTRSLPGVTKVALADRAPFFIGYDRRVAVSTTGAPCEPAACPTFPALDIGPGYFDTIGTALVSGREFQSGRAAPEVIVNQPLARQIWPEGGGVGRTLRVGDPGVVMTVVGVTARTHTRGLDREEPTLFLPIASRDFGGLVTLVARTAGPPDALVRSFVDASHAVDPDVAMMSVQPMTRRMAVQLWPFRTLSWMFSICGALGLVLATSGLAAVIIHLVNQRVREFGIRLAIGASARDLMLEVLGGSARLVVPGLAAGLVLAGIGARVAQAVFVGVNVLNPLVYVLVALVEAAVVMAACVGPALRAARVDPLMALRAD